MEPHGRPDGPSGKIKSAGSERGWPILFAPGEGAASGPLTDPQMLPGDKAGGEDQREKEIRESATEMIDILPLL